MKKTFFALLMVGLVAYSPAPIIDPRKNVRPQAEQTEEQLQAQQKYQGTQGEVGYVPPDTEISNTDYGQSDPNGADVMTNADKQQQMSVESAEAKNVLKTASNDLKGPGRSSFLLWIAILAGVLGFGVVAGLRAWANKSIPVPESKRYTL